MTFYTFKISKKILTFFVFFLVMTAWVLIKIPPYDMETFSKAKPIYEGRKDKNNGFYCNVHGVRIHSSTTKCVQRKKN